MRSSLSSASPKIRTTDLPEPEQEPAWHLQSLVGSLGSYVDRFTAALQLYNECDRVRNSVATVKDSIEGTDDASIAKNRQCIETIMRLSDWMAIPQRDAIMTTYHFAKVLDAIAFAKSPTLRKYVKHGDIRIARKLFRSQFPYAESLRHAIGHEAELSLTPADAKKNTALGPFDQYGIKVGKGIDVQIVSTSAGRSTISTIAKRGSDKASFVYAELSEHTLAKLTKITKLVYQAVEPAAQYTMDQLMEKIGVPKWKVPPSQPEPS